MVTRDYDPIWLTDKRTPWLILAPTFIGLSHSQDASWAVYARHIHAQVISVLRVRTPELVRPPKGGGGAQHAPRLAHLNWREALQLLSNGKPRSLHALPYALTPSLMRDLQAIGKRWYVHVSVPRGTVKGIKMLGL